MLYQNTTTSVIYIKKTEIEPEAEAEAEVDL